MPTDWLIDNRREHSFSFNVNDLVNGWDRRVDH